MQVNLNKALTGADEKPILEDGKELILTDIVVKVLEANYPGDEQVGFMKKLDRAKLARKIRKAEGVLDLRSDEITLIKDLAGRSASAHACLCLEELLEPPAETAKDTKKKD